MDVSGFFFKLKKQVGFHHQDSDEDMITDAGDTGMAANSEDRVDDGYLLVGETISERTTVYGANYSTQESSDHPPTYTQVSDELPSYADVLSGQYSTNAGSSVFSNVQLTPLTFQDSAIGRRHKTPISDVPFQLHSSLTSQQRINAIFNGVDLEPHTFNWAKYSHDFMNEKLCLRDLNCDEEANIDDFLFSTSNINTVTSLPSNNNSDVNLIDFGN